LKVLVIFVLGLLTSCWTYIYSEGITECHISSTDSMGIIEKVYLHTDRNTYFPGDDIWFKACLIDATDRSLFDHSNDLLVEIIYPESIIIDSRIVKITDGLLDNRTSVYHSANTRISGYSEPRIFYSPKHHSKLETDYKPDLRTTIFWEPNVKVENNNDFFLNFFNADNPSKVKIVVEGITITGVPVTGKVEYEVK
jgi:hypothetical protein